MTDDQTQKKKGQSPHQPIPQSSTHENSAVEESADPATSDRQEKKSIDARPTDESSDDKLTSNLNIGLFIATASLAILSLMQWNTMEKQIAIVEGQLEEMRKQTAFIRQQLVGSQAALLTLSVGVNHLGELYAGFQNSGQVTATDIYFKVEVVREELLTETRIGQPIIFEFNVPPIRSSLGFGQKLHLPWGQELSQSGEWPKNWPGSETFAVRAELKYQNGFGDLVEQEFCKKWLPNFSIKTKDGVSSGGGLEYPCKDIDVQIKSIIELKKKADQEKYIIK